MYFGYFTTDGIERFEYCRRSRYRVIHEYRVSWIEDAWDVVIGSSQAEGGVGGLKVSEQARWSLEWDVLVGGRDIVGDSGRREASASSVDWGSIWFGRVSFSCAQAISMALLGGGSCVSRMRIHRANGRAKPWQIKFVV